MDQIYQCNECNVTFPDKQTATGHRNGTGHTLTQLTVGASCKTGNGYYLITKYYS